MEPADIDIVTNSCSVTAIQIAFCKGPDGETIIVKSTEAVKNIEKETY